MTPTLLAKRIEDNLAWALAHGQLLPPPEPDEPVWPQLLALWPEPDEVFVRGLYPLLFGRQGESSGIECMLDSLRNGTPRVDLVRGLAHCAEAVRVRADASWLSRLALLSPSGLCSEIRHLIPRPAGEFVEGLYPLLYHRPAEEDERSRCLAALEGGQSRIDLVRTLADSPECLASSLDRSWLPRLERLTPAGMFRAARRLWGLPDLEFVEGLYDVLFCRPSDPCGRITALEQLARGQSRLDLIRQLVSSGEYASTNQGHDWLAWLDLLTPDGMWAELLRLWPLPAAEFVEGLYDLLLHRSPDANSRAYCLAQLEGGQTRVDLVWALAAFPECAARGLDLSWLSRLRRLHPEGVWEEILRCYARPAGEFVEGLFELLLNRPIDGAGRDYFVNQLDNGLSRVHLIRALADSPECTCRGVDLSCLERLPLLTPRGIWTEILRLLPLPAERFVEGIYRLLLHRVPAPDTLNSHLTALESEQSRIDLIRTLADSPECLASGLDRSWLPRLERITPAGMFQAVRGLWGLPDPEFVESLYDVLFCRPADPPALATALDRLAREITRLDLIRELVSSEEYTATNQTRDWLGWLDTLSAEGMWAELLRLWPLPAAEFVEGLYDLLLHRSPDADGKAYHLGLLADGLTRVDLIRSLTESAEFIARRLDGSWVGRLELLTPEGLWAALRRLWALGDAEFVTALHSLLLHRAAGPEEVAAFVAGLQRGEVRASVVRRIALCDEGRRRIPDTSWLSRLPEEVVVLPPSESTLREDESLLTIPDDLEFLQQSFRLILGRNPTEQELARHRFRLRYVPFWSRDWFLGRLRDRAEARNYVAWQQTDQIRDLIGETATNARLATDELRRQSRRCEVILERLERQQSRDQEARAELVERLESIALQQTRFQLDLDGVAGQVEAVARLAAPTEEVLRIAGQTQAEQARLLPAIGLVTGRIADLERAGQLQRSGQEQMIRSLGDARDQLNDLRQLAQYNRVQVEAAQHLLQQSQSEDQQRYHGCLQALQTALETAVLHHQQNQQSHEIQINQVRQVWNETQQKWFHQDQQLNQFRHTIARLLDRVPDDVGRESWVVSRGPSEEAPPTSPPSLCPPSTIHDSRLTPHAPRPTPHDGEQTTCRVCDGRVNWKWNKRVLNNRYEAAYHECRECGTLQVANPHWLAEAYRDENRPLFWNPDPGRFVRNFSVYCYLSMLQAAGLVGNRPRWLDYGGGYGLLTQMLKDGGHDAWLYDPYVTTPYFASDRRIASLTGVEAGSFDAVTAFEVFEHLENPREITAGIRRLLRPEGVLILSTGLYDPARHDADWDYLSCEAGQHITLWSREGLRRLAEQVGFRSVGYFPGNDGFLVILSPASAESLTGRLREAAGLLENPAFLDRVVGPWELIPRGQHRPPQTPRVDSVTSWAGRVAG
jgi:hypothetical protein